MANQTPVNNTDPTTSLACNPESTSSPFVTSPVLPSINANAGNSGQISLPNNLTFLNPAPTAPVVESEQQLLAGSNASNPLERQLTINNGAPFALQSTSGIPNIVCNAGSSAPPVVFMTSANGIPQSAVVPLANLTPPNPTPPEPAVDVNTIFQLLNDLKTELASVHGEIGTMHKDITTIKRNMLTVQGDVRTLTGEQGNVTCRLAKVEQTCSKMHVALLAFNDAFKPATVPKDFTFELIKSEAELVNFERNLDDKEFFELAAAWLVSRMRRQDIYSRLGDALELIFERTFFASCSWTGASRSTPKVPMSNKANVLKLFQRIATNSKMLPNISVVVEYFTKKLRYAKDRADLTVKKL